MDENKWYEMKWELIVKCAEVFKNSNSAPQEVEIIFSLSMFEALKKLCVKINFNMDVS